MLSRSLTQRNYNVMYAQALFEALTKSAYTVGKSGHYKFFAELTNVNRMMNNNSNAWGTMM